ncbi:MAG: hypothetical protein VCD00_06485 [Candidatus Hydrogenedentota bacterium]
MARIRTRKGKKLRWRNLILLGLLLVTFAGLIVVVNIGNTETELILPEFYAEQERLRSDTTQNAYFKVFEADLLIPIEPIPLLVPDPDSPQSKFDYQPDLDSIAALLGIKRPDDDPETLKYLDDTREVVTLAESASKMPRFINSHGAWTPTVNIWTYDSVLYPHKVLRVQLAHAVTKINHKENREDGLEALEAVYRLNSIFTNSVSGSGMWGNWGNYYNQVQSMYRRHDDPELRAALRDLLRNQSIPIPNIQRVLDTVLGSIDETLTYPGVLAEQGNDIRFDARIGVFILQHIANAIRERLPTLRTIADAHPSDYPDLIDALDWRDMTYWDQRNAYIAQDMISELLRAHQANAQYTATELSFTIEDYRSEHGAYPESLDALVPEYYDAIPLSPLSHQPFRYARVDDDKGYAIEGERVPLYEIDGEMAYQNIGGYVNYWRRIYRD